MTDPPTNRPTNTRTRGLMGCRSYFQALSSNDENMAQKFCPCLGCTNIFNSHWSRRSFGSVDMFKTKFCQMMNIKDDLCKRKKNNVSSHSCPRAGHKIVTLPKFEPESYLSALVKFKPTFLNLVSLKKCNVCL